jgi:hypothetical protein
MRYLPTAQNTVCTKPEHESRRPANALAACDTLVLGYPTPSQCHLRAFCSGRGASSLVESMDADVLAVELGSMASVRRP